MKKCSAFLIVCLLMAMLLPLSAQADGENALVLPSAMKTIEDGAFRYDSSIQTVAIPKGLRTIGSYAFAGSGVRRINLPNSITSIANNAFSNCSSALAVSATPGSYGFDWCVDHGITLGQTILPGSATAVIHTGGETVLYRFTPSATGRYTLTSTCANDTYGYLYDASGNELTHDDDGGDSTNFSITYNLTAGRTYLYEVKYYSSTRTGSITLRLEKECATIALGNTTATISTGGERVRYRFVPSVTASYTLRSTGSEDTYGYLYNASGTELAHDDDSGEGNNFSITYSLTGGSDYYYEVRFYNSTKTGSISLVLEKECPTISLGNTTATISTGGERARYRFVPSVTASYTLRSTGSDDTYGYLYDASGTQLAYNDDGGEGSNFSITYNLTAGNVYYYEVKFYSSTKTGTISLILEKECPTISLGNTTATISTGGERARFRFVPTATGSYTLKSTGSDDTCGYLYNASGTQLAYNDDGGEGNNFSITYNLTAGNVYYYEVKFYSSTKTGTISLNLSKASSSARYRALLIGNNAYSGNPLEGCINDMNAMAAMLSGLGNSFTCTKLSNATASQMRSAITSAFSGATSSDVSLFYYSGHGLSDNTSSGTTSSNGALCGVDHSFFYLSDLASALSNVSGRVIVMMDSCRSGAAVGKSEEDEKAEIEAFNQSVIDAFAEYDCFIEDDDFMDDETEYGDLKYGDLAKSKFIVITACRASQNSAELVTNRGLFTDRFVKGCGCTYGSGACSGAMPADTNRDNKLTVSEIYTYTRDQVSSVLSSQTPQYYASNTSEVMFWR